MPFRPDLDLTEFIEDYRPWMEGGEVAIRTKDYHESIPTEIRVTARVSVAGAGPLAASSCTALVVRPEIIWDVNGYYRDLGADVRADRKTLRECYLAANGFESEYLTYVLKQLLDPDVRREYDAMPLGEIYIDRYVDLAIKRNAMAEASRRAGRHATQEEVDAVAAEQGFAFAPADAVGGAPYVDPDEWRWSYYLDEVSCHDTDRLARWQTMLVTALSSLGSVRRFAVGFTKQDDTPVRCFTRTEHGGYVVAYIGATTEPDQNLADSIASQIIST